ncbi:unnamed protein product [Protopolystoma xenopodis]|uniref:Uncharacterized protein n=1 Tax=Protopolystoma xenopodis TaxID=117903 RepID=A0A3S5BMS3_9PLAT|nr:unnamed protein product [Protopolystoma xenopodis]
MSPLESPGFHLVDWPSHSHSDVRSLADCGNDCITPPGQTISTRHILLAHERKAGERHTNPFYEYPEKSGPNALEMSCNNEEAEVRSWEDNENYRRNTIRLINQPQGGIENVNEENRCEANYNEQGQPQFLSEIGSLLRYRTLDGQLLFKTPTDTFNKRRPFEDQVAIKFSTINFHRFNLLNDLHRTSSAIKNMTIELQGWCGHFTKGLS